MDIELFNENNTDVCSRIDRKFDFIYADCMYENKDFSWLEPAIRCLSKNGIFIIQTDYHTVADYKSIMNEWWDITFVNWLIYMNNWGGTPKNRFAQKHDDILVYCNGTNWKWYPDRIQIPKATAGTKFDKRGTGTKTPPSVFYDHPSFSTMSNEREEVNGKNFSMQKPLWLMERLLLPFTDEGDNVLDLFMGTGTLGEVCVKLSRNYCGIESDADTFEVSKKRVHNESFI